MAALEIPRILRSRKVLTEQKNTAGSTCGLVMLSGYMHPERPESSLFSPKT